MNPIAKTILTALVIVGASEAAKRSVILGVIIASLPLTSLLAISWIYVESRDTIKIAAFSDGIFWAVLASLPMFFVLSTALRKGIGFVPALCLSCMTGLAGYGFFLKFGPK